MDGIEVEVPAVPSFSFGQVVQEEVAPLGAYHCILELVADGCVGTADVEIGESSEAIPELGEVAVVELVHGAGVEAEVASYVIEVVAGSCQGDFSTDSVTSQGSHGDFVLVHEAGDIV